MMAQSSTISSSGLTVPLMTPEKTPMKSPRRSKSASKDHISIELSPMRLFTKKSSTVGSGRYLTPLQKLFSIFDLQEVHNVPSLILDNEDDEDDDHIYNNPPKTPTKNLITDRVVEKWHNEHLAQIAEEIDDEEETEIYREQLPNPFVEKKTITIINPFNKKPVQMANPFNPSNGKQRCPRQQIDYSTHMELINPKTGARIVRELSESEKSIKPKKLDFSHLLNDDENENNNNNDDDDDETTTDLDTPDTFTPDFKRRRMEFKVYEEGTP